jgi:hypothetical protein
VAPAPYAPASDHGPGCACAGETCTGGFPRLGIHPDYAGFDPDEQLPDRSQRVFRWLMPHCADGRALNIGDH